MFCTKCGKQIVDGQRFCTACGADNGVSVPQGGGFNNPNPMNSFNASYINGFNTSPNQGYLPMNWYKFLIYFALFASAILNLISGFLIITGKTYEIQSNGWVSADLVYTVYGALQPLDIFYGLCAFCFVALAIIIRMKLAAYKSDGPNYLALFYIVNAVVNFLYYLIASIILDQNLFTASPIINIAVSVVMVFVNKLYFEKRKHMFIN